MHTYAYIRVSTDRQDLDNQRHGVIEYARRYNLEPITFFEDTASGKKDWRDRDLGRLLSTAKPGDILLVAEISRLARSALQVLEVLKVAAEGGVTVHVAKNHLVMDGSLHSRITATVLGLAAEIEREFISARTTEALARRKAQGLPLGRPKGAKSLSKKLDKNEAKIREYLSKGIAKTSIAKLMEVSPDTLYKYMHEKGMDRYITRKQKPKKKGLIEQAIDQDSQRKKK